MAQVEDEWVFTMREVFQEAQTQIISNEPYKSLNAQENDSFFAPFARRFVKILSNEVPSNDVQEFIEEIWIALGRILLETQVKVEIVIGFASLIGTFIGLDLKSASKKSVNQRDSIQPEVLDRVRNEILERLMDATRVEDKSVRLKACQMLQVILNKLEFIE
jgi:hypothetical protein